MHDSTKTTEIYTLLATNTFKSIKYAVDSVLTKMEITQIVMLSVRWQQLF